VRTLAVVAFSNGVSIYVGRLNGVGAVLTTGRRVVAPAGRNVLWAPLRRLMPHLRVMDVWRERLRDVILHGGPHLLVDGSATPGGPWRFLVREWTRLRRSSESGECRSFILRSRCTVPDLLFYLPAHQKY
jgi:hypothetical protein